MEVDSITEPGPILIFLGHVAYELSEMQPYLPMYIHLIVSAVFPIYTAAFASLSRPSSAARTKKTKRPRLEGDEDSDDDDEEIELKGPLRLERFSPSDAIMLPVISGSTLAGLYFLIKWLKDPAIINKILNIYFSQIGLILAIKFGKDVLSVLRSFVFPVQYSRHGYIWRIRGKHTYQAITEDSDLNDAGQIRLRNSPLPGFLSSIRLPSSVEEFLWRIRDLAYQKAVFRAHVRSIFTLKTPIDTLDVLTGIIATSAVSYFVFVAKPWWLTNFIGFSFSYGALQYMSPTTFWTGTLILSSLFLYDIYFVFFTPLMVTVAQSLDVPVKLLFPRPPEMEEDPSRVSFAMLGLGDVVLPGMMIVFALRYDLWLYYEKKRLASALIADGTKTRAPYQNVLGGWGERFWTRWSSLNPRLSTMFGSYQNSKTFPKTYFHAAVVGYVFGLVVTILVMQVTGHAQPALLYLAPGVLIPLWGTALFKGEIKTMWNFVEDEDEGHDSASIEAKSKKSGTTNLGSDAKDRNPESKDPKHSTAKESTDKKKKSPAEDEDLNELISISLSLPQKSKASKQLVKKPLKQTQKPDPPSPSLSSSSSSSSSLSSSPELPRKSPRRVQENGEPRSRIPQSRPESATVFTLLLRGSPFS